MKPLLAGVAILKNEAESARSIIASMKGVVDHVTILDTGSTDETQEVIRIACSDLEIPLCLCEGPFEDFSTTRNKVMQIEAERDNAAVFNLMLSGDETLHNVDGLREFLEAERGSEEDAFDVEVRQSGYSFPRPRILRTGSSWKYEGTSHEKPVDRVHNIDRPSKCIPTCYIEHAAGDIEKSLDETWERVVPVFRATLDVDPRDARALLFLGLAHASLAPYVAEDRINEYMTAMAYLQRRIDVGGDDGEVVHARLRFLECARMIGIFTREEVVSRAAALCVLAPWHPDVRVLHALALSKAVKVKEDYADVLRAAMDAIRVAKEFKVGSIQMPVERSSLWRAYFIAATTVKIVAGVADPRVEEYAKAGVEAGGPSREFQKLFATAEAKENKETVSGS